jgi:SlyX protein
VEARITDLEMRLAFQDDTLSTMSDEMLRQQREIERLQAQVALLLKRQNELVERVEMDGGASEAPPPHY